MKVIVLALCGGVVSHGLVCLPPTMGFAVAAPRDETPNTMLLFTQSANRSGVFTVECNIQSETTYIRSGIPGDPINKTETEVITIDAQSLKYKYTGSSEILNLYSAD